MDIIEGNKTIAEFMGLTPNPHDGGKTYGEDAFVDPLDGMIWAERWQHLYYEKSWDELMPAVEKIEQINDLSSVFSVRIEDGECRIIECFVSAPSALRFQREGSSKISAVWNAVVAFIEWYNTQAKHNS